MPVSPIRQTCPKITDASNKAHTAATFHLMSSGALPIKSFENH
jgi:hypothetical protein